MPERVRPQDLKRWCQILLTDSDVERMDVDWWVARWKEWYIDTLVLSTASYSTFYPTEVPFQRRSPGLGDRDFFGEICEAASANGVAVVGRLDPNRAGHDMLEAHPDWFMRDSRGEPIRVETGTGAAYLPCGNGGHHWEHVPGVLEEMFTRYPLVGCFGNRWTGVGFGARNICYCANCQRIFREDTGLALPTGVDWDDPSYAEWVAWRSGRTTRLWAHLDSAIKSVNSAAAWMGGAAWHGGWAGTASSMDLRDCAALSDMFAIDLQSRGHRRTHWVAAQAGKYVRNIAGPKPAMHIFAVYPREGAPPWSFVARPDADLTLWMAESRSVGLRPWVACVSAYQEDTRWAETVRREFQFHKANEDLFVDLEPAARVAIVLDTATAEYYGRDDPQDRFSSHLEGAYYAALRRRIPVDIVDSRSLPEQPLDGYSAVVLPNAACLSPEVCDWIERFFTSGGGVVATHETALYSERGQRLSRGRLEALFGVEITGDLIDLSDSGLQSYLRPDPASPLSRSLAGAPLVPVRGSYLPVEPGERTRRAATLAPPFEWFPMETGSLPLERTDVPMAVTHESGGRSVYFPWDIFRFFWHQNFPETGDMLADAIEWAAGDDTGVSVTGEGVLDVHPNRAGDRIVIHMVNLTDPNMWKGPTERIVPVGPQTVRVSLAGVDRCRGVRLVRADREVAFERTGGAVSFEVPGVDAYESAVLDLS